MIRKLGSITVHISQNHLRSGKISQHIKRYVKYRANITITIGFISLMFCVTYFFNALNATTQKYINTILSRYCVVPGARF